MIPQDSRSKPSNRTSRHKINVVLSPVEDDVDRCRTRFHGLNQQESLAVARDAVLTLRRTSLKEGLGDTRSNGGILTQVHRHEPSVDPSLKEKQLLAVSSPLGPEASGSGDRSQVAPLPQLLLASEHTKVVAVPSC